MAVEPRKIALITGAAQGIGAAIATVLANHVDALVLLDIAPGWESETASIGQVQTLRYRCNVGDSTDVAKALAEAEKSVGTPNVVVNNAGKGGPFHRVDEVSDSE